MAEYLLLELYPDAESAVIIKEDSLRDDGTAPNKIFYSRREALEFAEKNCTDYKLIKIS